MKKSLDEEAALEERLEPELLEEFERGLHDLCQPLTTLQCRLELGQMAVDRESLLDTVQGSLGDMAVLFQIVGEMRDRLLQSANRNATEDWSGVHDTN